MSNSRKNEIDNFDCKGIFYRKDGFINPPDDVCSLFGVKANSSKEPTKTVTVYNNGLWKLATFGDKQPIVDQQYKQGNWISKFSCEVPESYFAHCLKR